MKDECTCEDMQGCCSDRCDFSIFFILRNIIIPQQPKCNTFGGEYLQWYLLWYVIIRYYCHEAYYRRTHPVLHMYDDVRNISDIFFLMMIIFIFIETVYRYGACIYAVCNVYCTWEWNTQTISDDHLIRQPRQIARNNKNSWHLHKSKA